VANRLAAPTITHASRRRQRGIAKIGAAEIDLARQAIRVPINEGKIVRSENDFTRRARCISWLRREMSVMMLSSAEKTQCLRNAEN
jgi:hypothetical protein